VHGAGTNDWPPGTVSVSQASATLFAKVLIKKCERLGGGPTSNRSLYTTAEKMLSEKELSFLEDRVGP